MMQRLKYYMLLSIAILAGSFVGYSNAQETFRFSHFGLEDGLSQSCVTSFWQDEFDMIWIGTQDGLNRYDGVNVEVFRPVSGDTTSLFSNNIRAVHGNNAGKLYVFCKNALCEMDLATEKFRTISEDNVMAINHSGNTLWVCKPGTLYIYNDRQLEEYYKLGTDSKINCVYETSSGHILIGTASGIVALDQNRKDYTMLPGRNIINIFEDTKKNIWLSTQFDGLYKVDKSGKMQNYRYSPGDPLSLTDNYVRTVCEDFNGNYWIGTFKGINVFNPATQTMLQADHSNQDPNSLQHSSIWALLCDHQGTIWIGSYYGGISRYNGEYDFYRFHKNIFGNHLSVINCIMDDGKGAMWLGTEGAGLLHYDAHTGKYEIYNAGPGLLSSDNIKSIYLDEKTDRLWLGTLLGGLNCLDAKTGRTRVYMHVSGDDSSLPNNSVRKIVPYEKELILATHSGIVKFDPVTGKCERLSGESVYSHRYISDMIVDSNGNCWFSVSEGVVRYDLKTDSFREYLIGDTALGSSHILVFFEDSRGRIWLGSSGRGVFLFDTQSDSFTNYNTRNSMLVNDYILDIDESALGYILFATNGGFVRYDHERNHFYSYNNSNGFPVSHISPYGLFVSGEKHIYVSGYKVLMSFDEIDLAEKKIPSRIHFTSLRVNNCDIKAGGKDGILQRSLLYQNKIDLYSRHSVFEINYTTSNYIPYAKNDVEYRLSGFDADWIKGSIGKPIIYSNLAPQTYTLTVRCVDARSKEVLASSDLSIEIHPPFHKTTWAYIILFLLVITITTLLIRFYWGKLKLRSSLAMEKHEKKRVEELNQSKQRFFTYISHELRTPVTLIQGQIDAMLQKNQVPPLIYPRISALQQNVAKITRLINELLDFRKQEDEFTPIYFTAGNIVGLMNKIYVAFKDYAAFRNIDITFESTSNEIKLWYDAEQLEKVFWNLLSNAFKHTAENGVISIGIYKERSDVVIRISDSGSGIDPRYQEDIFSPFFQVPGNDRTSQGTGLGLTIAKGIVESHYGTISVDSKIGQGASFSVSLPCGDRHIPEELKCDLQDEDQLCINPLALPDKEFINEIASSQAESGVVSASIMIVEDNEELRKYLKTLFEAIYDVTEACDGLDAWNKLGKALPDIILSDLIMPNVDGYELCIKVKRSFATCHIPFVLLTAKVAMESTLEGFKYGADDYIAKPFDSRILIAKCNALVNSRRIMQSKFTKSKDAQPHIIATNAIDRKLMEKAIAIVSKNLHDPNFGVEEFAREMALGRTKLFTKLKGVTGQTPNEFIMNMRMKKSILLLESDSGHSIGEISFMVGFNSPSYFIKSFRSLYGITPAGYIKKLKQDKPEEESPDK